MAPNPYSALAPHHFWRNQVTGRDLTDIDYDAGRKFRFDVDRDRFATVGSCFAQHFGRELQRKGGQLHIAESRHPLIPEQANHGYGMFSARYGNVYTTRQLRELVEQAFGLREPIFEWAQTAEHRWTDMLRPRAVGDGFSSVQEAESDRRFHLSRVKSMFHDATVFVFTLGLTECWENIEHGYVYPVCPGTAAGDFDSTRHAFRNLTYPECVGDMNRVLEIILGANPDLRVLLTVSPVMLVASCDIRGALQSSVASKSILRAVADECRNSWDAVDYFPSFEIISGPQSRGRFYDAGGRDVTADGVELVMATFFKSRTSVTADQVMAPAPHPEASALDTSEIARALQAECDELLLDPGLAGS